MEKYLKLIQQNSEFLRFFGCDSDQSDYMENNYINPHWELKTEKRYNERSSWLKIY